MTDYPATIAELRDFVMRWQVCSNCEVVDDDEGRVVSGHNCRTCGMKSTGGHMYFEASIQLLVGLIQETARADQAHQNKGLWQGSAHGVSVLLFFCTLREVLMNHFLAHLYFAQHKDSSIFHRMMEDNRGYTNKQNKVFRTLTAHRWRDALRILSEESQYSYLDLNKKLEAFAKARNEFTHEGWSWNTGSNTAKECVLCVEPLIQLYVDLHNALIHIRPGFTWQKKEQRRGC